ncbi:hypothetical protein KY290_033222 [Solanum tuberosum]|uniref:Uncharacterized protein n=1 Tax=Solanum tuberosum TaxID=4113 RepID=A0ABQ7U1K6_SOLTU|nr:hypothetical protein KY290_033222 [Solanum tuberosum]
MVRSWGKGTKVQVRTRVESEFSHSILNSKFEISQEPKSCSFVQEINPNPTKFGRQAGWAAVAEKGCGSCWNGLVRAAVVDVCKLLLTLLGFSVYSRVGEEERERRGHFFWAAVRMFGSL